MSYATMSARCGCGCNFSRFHLLLCRKWPGMGLVLLEICKHRNNIHGQLSSRLCTASLISEISQNKTCMILKCSAGIGCRLQASNIILILPFIRAKIEVDLVIWGGGS